VGKGLFVVIYTQDRAFWFHQPSAIHWRDGHGDSRKPTEAFLYM